MSEGEASITQARMPAASPGPDTAADLPVEHQISDRPEPMPLWVAWVGLTVLTLCAAWALYAYIVTQYVPE